MWSKFKNICLLVAIFIIAFYYVKDRIREHQHAIDMAKIDFMDGNLNRLVDITNGLIRETRLKNGKVITRSTFVPPEGTTRITEDKKGKVTVIKQNKGFTFRPGVSMSFHDGRLKLGGSFKVFYWSRLGSIVNVDRYGLSVGVSRYIDDLVPLHPRNVEVYMGYYVAYFRSERERLNLGLRISF